MREFEGVVQNLCIHMCENGLDTRTPPPCRHRSSRSRTRSILIVGGLRFRSTAIRFLKFVWYFNSRFSASVSQKRLELKSLKGQTKAEELGTPGPKLLSLRLLLKAL